MQVILKSYDSSVLCANNVRFIGKDDHITNKPGISLWDSGRGDSYKTYVGNDIGFVENVTVLAEVSFGDGAIIAARSVVTKDVLPCTVVGGNPARFIKKRFLNESDSLKHLNIVNTKSKHFDVISKNKKNTYI